MSGFNDPETVQKAIEIRKQNRLAKENAEPTTIDAVIEQIAITRLEFIQELAALNPKKLARTYFDYLTGAQKPTKEQALLWRDFMATMMPTLSAAESKRDAGEGAGAIEININPPAEDSKPAIDVTPKKAGL